MNKNIKTYKLSNGEEVKIDIASSEFSSYENAAKMIGLVKNDDAFFFARNLEFVRNKIFQPEYAELKLINGGVIPLNTSIPEGAESDTYDVLDSTGQAKIISDFADDIPTVEVFGNQYTNKIRSVSSAYIYSVQDMRRDSMLGKDGHSVIINKALAARKSVDQTLEKLLGFGDTNFGITGMFNNPNVSSIAVASTGTGSSPLWTTKTAKQILDDVDTAINDMVDASNGSEMPTHMLLDHTSYSLIRTKVLDATNYSGMSVLKYITEQFGLEVDWMQQLKNGFLSSTASGFVLYNKSIEKVEGIIPLRLKVHAPQIKNLATKNIVEARCGGTRVFFPKSLSYNYGI